MVGDDEARARAVLAEMQLRISQGPTSALGVGEIVTANEVRAAFLGLTKQFHPARFGRLSPDLQRLANEVFLGIKGAHDHMLKVLGSSPATSRGGRSMSNGAPVAVASNEGTSRTPTPSPAPTSARSTQSMPRLERLEAPSASGAIPSLARGTDRSAHASSAAGTGSAGTGSAGTGTAGTGTAGSAPPRSQTGSVPIRQPVPPGTQPGVGVAPGTAAPSANASQKIPAQRISQPIGTLPTQPPRASSAITPASPPTQPPPRAADFDPPTIRGLTPPAPAATQSIPRPGPAPAPAPTPASPPAPAGDIDETALFKECAALMEQKQWTRAREALHVLAMKVPQSRVYRAWLCYARGREAYLAGRPDDAILEMQRALQYEPDLAHAKHALTELQRRR